MKTRVRLTEIVDALDFESDLSSRYLDRRSGEVILLTDEQFSLAESGAPLEEHPEWKRKGIAIARRILQGHDDEHLEVPTRFEVNEYGIMERFCLSLEDHNLSDSLRGVISGENALQRFKDTVVRLGLQETWDRYRREALERFAKEWCEDHGIEYV